MWWYGNGMGAWGFGLMAAGWIVFLALVVFAIVLLVRYVSRGGLAGNAPQAGQRTPGQQVSPGQQAAPESVLAERFARGEIDEEEYRQRLATLREASPR